MRFRDILDGLANTIYDGEIPTDLTDNDTRIRPVRSTTNTRIACGIQGCDGDIDPTRPQFWRAGPNFVGYAGGVNSGESGRGYKWAMGRGVWGYLTIISPPNCNICVSGGGANEFSGGFYPPGSRHQGGCHVLMGDGAIKFITDSIESGNQNSQMVYEDGGLAPGSQSPFGLWGTLGTRGGKEVSIARHARGRSLPP